MIALAMIGKMVAAAAYATIYLFTAELFPTVIRSTVINLSSFSGSLGNIVAPYIVVLVRILKMLRVPRLFKKKKKKKKKKEQNFSTKEVQFNSIYFCMHVL